MSDEQLSAANDVRYAFDVALAKVAQCTPQHNARYLALVKTKMEEACFFAIKGIAKPLQS